MYREEASRRTKRGVTTVQPGFEDETRSIVGEWEQQKVKLLEVSEFEQDKDSESVAVGMERSPSTRGKSMLGFFVRSRKDEKSPAVESKESSPTKAASSLRDKDHRGVDAPAGSPKSTNHQLLPKRDKDMNSQANLLRRQIATTEYELQRLTKTLGKKKVPCFLWCYVFFLQATC
jgi:hypothetical protein